MDPQTDSIPEKTPQKRQRLMLRTLLVSGAKFIAFLAAILGVLGISLWLYIAQAGGLAALLSARASSADLGLETRIGDASLSFFEQGFEAQILLSDVSMSLGSQKLAVPEARLRFDVPLLLSGHVFELILSRLQLDLLQAEDGVSLAGDWAALNQLLMPQGEAASAGPTGLPPILANRRLSLADSVLTLQKAGTTERLVFADVALRVITDDATGLQIDGAGRLGDGDASQISFAGFTNLQSGLSDLSLTSTSVPLSDWGAFLPDHMRPIAQLGTLDGTASLLLDGSIIQSAVGDITATNGTLPNGMALSDISASLRYSRQDDYLVIPSFLMRLADGQSLGFTGNLVALSSPKLGFDGDLSFRDMPIESLLSQWPDTALSDVKTYMISSLSGGDFETLSVRFKGQFDKPLRALSLSELSLSGEVAQVRVQTGFGQYEQFVGTANGALSFEVASGGQLKQAEVALDISDGFLRTAYEPEALRFDSVSGRMIYEPGSLRAEDIKMTFAEDGQLAGDFEMAITDSRDIAATKLTLSAPQLSLHAYRHLFPKALSEATHAFIAERLAGGAFSDVSLVFATAQKRPGASAQDITALQASAKFAGASLRYLEGQAPLDGLSGLLTLSDNELSLFIDDGTSPSFDITSAEVRLAPLIAPKGQARLLAITADARGGLADVVPLLASPQIGLREHLPVNLDGASGALRARLSFGADLVPDTPMRLALTSLEATITDGAAPQFFQSYDLDKADLVLDYRQGALDITGAASLGGLAGDFALSQTADNLSIQGQIAPSTTLTDYAAQASGVALSGAIGGAFAITSGDGGQTIKADLSADLAQASLYIPLLNWAKLQGEDATASGTIYVGEGHLRRVDNMQITTSDLSVAGHLEMTDTGSFSAAYLQDLRFPGNQIDEVLIEQSGDNSLTIIADGPRIDLRPLREGQEGGAGQAVRFDITAADLVIEDDISLTGQITGFLGAQGQGEAKLQGALLQKAKPLLQEGTITVLFGEGGEYLNAVGLIGGAEARLEFSPNEDEGSILIITTANAGRVLSGLGITDTIRSGRMVLVNTYPTGAFDRYDTVINLEEFNVIEAPAAVRAFSVLGLAGLYSLVEGDGTRFTRGELQLQTTGTQHDIIKMQASGGAVGVTMVGTYNSATRQVDISGNLVPVNQFSKIVGAVPLLGNLLAGVDNAGIFATQFNITGPIDDPETSVNAASLVPGVIRDLFSPDWLGRELDRILGADNESE